METKTSLTRRDLLKKAWAVAGAAALGESLFVGLRFLSPRQMADEFGSVIHLGLANEYLVGSVTPFVNGRFFLVRLHDGGFMALYRRCPHLGCAISHDPEGNKFRCACHASAFSLDGQVLNPPATRPLDLFPITIENGELLVDTGQTIERSQVNGTQITYLPEELS